MVIFNIMQEIIETDLIPEASQADGITIRYYGSIFSDMWIYADNMEITITKQLPRADGIKMPPQVSHRNLKGSRKHEYGLQNPKILDEDSLMETISEIEQVETMETLAGYGWDIHIRTLSEDERSKKFYKVLMDAKAAYSYFLVKTRKNLDPLCITHFEHLHYHLLSIARQSPTLRSLTLTHFPIDQGARIFRLS